MNTLEEKYQNNPDCIKNLKILGRILKGYELYNEFISNYEDILHILSITRIDIFLKKGDFVGAINTLTAYINENKECLNCYMDQLGEVLYIIQKENNRISN